MSLTEAVDFAIKHSRPDAGVISVDEAIDRALETKRSKRPSYVRDLRKRWARFREWLPAAKRKALNTISQLDVRRYLTARKLSPQGERNELRNLSVLFSWAVQHHHMPANPCSGIKVDDSPSEEPVRVLSIAEIKHLLELAQMNLQATLKVGKTKMSVIKVYPGELVPWLVLGLFAGLRPEETVRLDWADIDFDCRQIDLPAKKAKGRTRRIITIEPNLIEWLKAYRPVDGKGKVVSNFRWHLQVFQRSAGPEWNPWPKDCLRHSYGSFHLAKVRLR
jgi:integrase